MLAVFQLTPSRRATVFLYHVLRHGEYFNSRPHGGRRTTNAGAVGTIISTHALTEGDATKVLFRSLYAFQLTPSRRATEFLLMVPSYLKHFNSRPHGGRPGHRNCKNRVAGHFNSRPHGGRQKQQYFNEYGKRFQLTPSRRATALVREFSIVHDISTHALTEGDSLQPMTSLRSNISTHALTEGDTAPPCVRIRVFCISTHALTEGDIPCPSGSNLSYISTHALTEGDVVVMHHISGKPLFQLTPSRRATSCVCFLGRNMQISTHALTEGDSEREEKKMPGKKDFNSRPHGGRR